MTSPRYSVTSSSLKSLRIGEGGIISSFQKMDDLTRIKLGKIGIRPGMSITVEQQSPRFVVRIGTQTVALSDTMIQALSVRRSTAEKHTGLTSMGDRSNQLPSWRLPNTNAGLSY